MLADSESLDDNDLRDMSVRQLVEIVKLAYGMAMNDRMDLASRERWTQKYTNAVLVLNQILKDRQQRNWERRLEELEKYGKIPRRTILGIRLEPEPLEWSQRSRSPRSRKRSLKEEERS